MYENSIFKRDDRNEVSHEMQETVEILTNGFKKFNFVFIGNP
jgi:hypothetical protein